VKWGGVVVFVVALTVWIGSVGRYLVWRPSQRASLEISSGALWIWTRAPSVPASDEPTFSAHRTEEPFVWWFHSGGWRGVRLYLAPGWSIAALAAAITGAAWRFDGIASQRAQVGCCASCNYDRRGIPAASVCPECGAAPAAPAQANT
jgi:hypothetical protein